MTKGAQQQTECRRELFGSLATGLPASPRTTGARDRELEPSGGYRENGYVRKAYQAIRF